jgi:hypothetical protein
LACRTSVYEPATSEPGVGTGLGRKQEKAEREGLRMKKKRYFLMAAALLITIFLSGCEAFIGDGAKEGIEQDITEFPVEMVKDDSVFVLKEPEFYYYDSPGVNYGFCVLRIDTSGAKEEDVELLNTADLDSKDGEDIWVSMYILQNDDIQGIGDSLRTLYSTYTDTESTFVLYTGASKEPYQDMLRSALQVYVTQSEMYEDENFHEMENKINKYWKHWGIEELRARKHVAESYEAMDSDLWQAIEPKLIFKSIEDRKTDFENGIKKKIHDAVKAGSVRRKTSNAVSIIRQLAQENAGNPGIDDSACILEILKKYRNLYLYPDNRPAATGEELELLLYSSIFLKNRFYESSSYYALGDLIESPVVSAYIGVNNKIEANRELIEKAEEDCEFYKGYASEVRFH